MHTSRDDRQTMTSKERMDTAMRKEIPDRVPAMCQLSIGHYLLNTGISPAEVWHSSEGFARALVMLCDRYRFDGILINLPGHPADWKRDILKIEKTEDGETVYWKDGSYTWCPNDDNVQNYRVHPKTGKHVRDIHLRLTIDEVNIDNLFPSPLLSR